MIRVRYTLALLFSLALLAGTSKLALSQHPIPTSNTSSIVQVADVEDPSTTGIDPDTVEQGPDGVDVEG